jgi:DNA-binding NarL/FixJ family response regulator
MIEQQLKSVGYSRLLTFTTGNGCTNNLHLMPDIILLDYNLRETTGIEVLKQIKLHNQNAYVFFLSAQEEIDIAINSIKHGAFGYVVKTNMLLEIYLKKSKVLFPTRQ